MLTNKKSEGTCGGGVGGLAHLTCNFIICVGLAAGGVTVTFLVGDMLRPIEKSENFLIF